MQFEDINPMFHQRYIKEVPPSRVLFLSVWNLQQNAWGNSVSERQQILAMKVHLWAKELWGNKLKQERKATFPRTLKNETKWYLISA